MCGITGIYAYNELGRLFMINLAKANDTLSRRGPDAGRIFTDQKVGLAHRRLSVIDLSVEANQPMTDPGERYTIVFNGEIYNYRQIKSQLENQGVAFRTQCDTEVLLQAYIHYGADCLPMLNGFFAFAIFDAQENSLFLARDRYGIKPLVYFNDEDKFIFASNIRALLAYNIPKEMDYTALAQYFQLSYIPAPRSIFKQVHKLRPGHYLKLEGRNCTEKAYYHLQKPDSYANAPTYSDAGQQLMALLEQLVQDRLVADVPLGAFLSGGIDSSVVVALASRHTDQLNTFSIGFKNEPLFDETKYANLVAEKYQTHHTVFQLHTDDYYEHIQQLLGLFGEPFADASAIPFYILSQRTRQKATVALSGDGADEIFAGYNKYLGEFKARENGLAARLLQGSLPLLSRLPKNRNSYLANKFRQLHRFAEGMHLSPQERYWYLCSWKQQADVRQMLHTNVLEKIDETAFDADKASILGGIKGSDFNEVLLADVHLLLQNDMLHKVDAMSMAHGLEVRVPFLDHRVVDFAFGLPAEYKINGRMKKRILQDAARPLLPEALYNRPKHGFDVPLAKGYKTDLRQWIENSLLNDDFVAEQGIFQPAYISQLKQQIFHTSHFDQNQVWAILAFQQWWKNTFSS